MTDDHKIEKEARAVALTLSNGELIEGHVFLRLYESHHSGPQNLGDLLNGKNPFIPIKTKERVFLINSTHIVQAQVCKEQELDELMQLGESHTVTLKMVLGHEITGTIYISLRDGFPRVKDYVNQATAFLRFFKDEHVLYIRQCAILSATD